MAVFAINSTRAVALQCGSIAGKYFENFPKGKTTTDVIKEMKSKARYMRSKSCKEILGSSYDKYVSHIVYILDL